MMRLKIMRRRLYVGQDYRSDDGNVQGVIVKVWPVETGSEALVQVRATGELMRVFIANEKQPKKLASA